jgi:hypothetical protein
MSRLPLAELHRPSPTDECASTIAREPQSRDIVVLFVRSVEQLALLPK